MILSVISSMIKALGCHCSVAQDGADGLRQYLRAKDEGKPFAAVLLDATIPNGIAGAEALKLLLDADSQARVILCSGYADSDLFKNSERLGFKAVLSKPFGMSEFISVLNKAI
jgi:two-component system cell cycle sensor histidine kinase/response regulator CckA